MYMQSNGPLHKVLQHLFVIDSKKHKGYNRFCNENSFDQNTGSLILSTISSGNRRLLFLVVLLSTGILGIPFVRVTFTRSGLNFAARNYEMESLFII